MKPCYYVILEFSEKPDNACLKLRVTEENYWSLINAFGFLSKHGEHDNRFHIIDTIYGILVFVNPRRLISISFMWEPDFRGEEQFDETGILPSFLDQYSEEGEEELEGRFDQLGTVEVLFRGNQVERQASYTLELCRDVLESLSVLHTIERHDYHCIMFPSSEEVDEYFLLRTSEVDAFLIFEIARFEGLDETTREHVLSQGLKGWWAPGKPNQ